MSELRGYVSFKDIAQFMIGFLTKEGIKFNKDAVFTEDNLNSYINEFKEYRKSRPSPTKIFPNLNYTLYCEWIKNNSIETDIYDKIYSYTGEKIAMALNDMSIDAQKLVNTLNFSKKKKILTNALINAYKTQFEGNSPSKRNFIFINDDDDDDDNNDDDEHNHTDDDDDDNNDDINKKKLIDQAIFNKHSVKELKNICTQRNLTFDKNFKKEQLIQLLLNN